MRLTGKPTPGRFAYIVKIIFRIIGARLVTVKVSFDDFLLLRQIHYSAWHAKDLASDEEVFLKSKKTRVPFDVRYRTELLLNQRLGEIFRDSKVLRVPRLLGAGPPERLLVLEWVGLQGDVGQSSLNSKKNVRDAFCAGLAELLSVPMKAPLGYLPLINGVIHDPVLTGFSLSLRASRELGLSRLWRLWRLLIVGWWRQRRIGRFLLHNDLKTRHNWALDEHGRFVVFDLERAGITRKWPLFDLITVAFDQRWPRKIDQQLIANFMALLPEQERGRINIWAQIAVAVAVRATGRVYAKPETHWLIAFDEALDQAWRGYSLDHGTEQDA